METSTAILEQSKQNSIFYVYDERMLKHREYPKPQAEGSTVKVHVNPEIPDRISSIYNHLKIEGLLDQMDKIEVQGVDEVEQLIATIHSQEIIDKVKDLQILLFDNECKKKN